MYVLMEIIGDHIINGHNKQILNSSMVESDARILFSLGIVIINIMRLTGLSQLYTLSLSTKILVMVGVQKV